MPERYARKMTGSLCYLAPMEPDDFRLFAGWLNDPEVAVNLRALQQTISIHHEREIVESLTKTGHHYTIVEGSTNQPIGVCGLDQLDPINRCAEVGIFIGQKDRWSQGVGAEAMSLLLDYGFGVLNLESVMLEVSDFNQRAIRCYQKVGFKEIGRRRKARIVGGRRFDRILMDILATEFEGGPIHRMIEEIADP